MLELILPIKINIRSTLFYCGISTAVITFFILLVGIRAANYDSALEYAIHASTFTKLSTNMPLMICVPLLIDMALDGYFNARHGIFLSERLTLIGGYILPSLVHIIMSNREYSLRSIAAVVGCLYACQIPFNASIIFSLMVTSTIANKEKFFYPLFWTLIALCVGLIFGIAHSTHDNGKASNLIIGYWVMISACFVNYIIFLGRYLYAYFSLDVKPVEEMLPLSLCIVQLIDAGALMCFPIFLGQYTYLDCTESSLIAINIITSLTYICAISLPGRCSRNLMHETQRTIDSKRAFVRYISHEIRTPANICGVGMGLVVEQLKELKLFGGEMKEILNQVQDSLFSISETLNNLLEFENVDSGALEINVVEVRPLDFVRTTLKLLEMQAKQNGIHFSLPDASETRYGCLAESTIEVDIYKMGQALRNFVSNAIKVTPIDGKIAVAVEPFCAQCHRDALDHGCTAHIAEPWIRISVADSGDGMSAKTLQKLQQDGSIRFDHSNLEPGQASGLSLFISKNIIEKHGGVMAVESNGSNGGSIFSIELPLFSLGKLKFHVEIVSGSTRGEIFRRSSGDSSVHRESALNIWAARVIAMTSRRDDAISRPRSKSGSQASRDHSHVSNHNNEFSLEVPNRNILEITDFNPNGNAQSSPNTDEWKLEGRHILCVDDSAMNLKIIMKLFKKLGAVCDEAVNGAIAVQLVKDSLTTGGTPYDFIVMDNFMPEMSGPEACKLMREAGFTSPIFGLTGHVLEIDMKQFYRAGANHVFQKPLNMKEFHNLAQLHNLISMPRCHRVWNENNSIHGSNSTPSMDHQGDAPLSGRITGLLRKPLPTSILSTKIIPALASQLAESNQQYHSGELLTTQVDSLGADSPKPDTIREDEFRHLAVRNQTSAQNSSSLTVPTTINSFEGSSLEDLSAITEFDVEKVDDNAQSKTPVAFFTSRMSKPMEYTSQDESALEFEQESYW